MDSTTKKYVWLNPDDKFSNSWDEALHETLLTEKEISEAAKKGWRLIEYTCINNPEFEFYNKMRLA